MRLQFLGSGDAFGSGGRFNTCILVESETGAFLIDCGASSLIAMRKYGIDPNRVDTVFISHLHGDHFGGLPFLILDAQFYSRRTRPLTLVGPRGFRDRLMQVMELLFPGSSRVERRFATEIHEIDAAETAVINGITVTAYLVEHACGAPPFALRFVCDGKVFAYRMDGELAGSRVPCGSADRRSAVLRAPGEIPLGLRQPEGKPGADRRQTCDPDAHGTRDAVAYRRCA